MKKLALPVYNSANTIVQDPQIVNHIVLSKPSNKYCPPMKTFTSFDTSVPTQLTTEGGR